MSIYLDNNATTHLDPEVREEMMSCLDQALGNPSSLHAPGQEARRVIDKARSRVARLIGAKPDEIVFTSGGTEANNLAVFGAVGAARLRHPHVITTAIEHQAVLNPCMHLEEVGSEVTFLPVDGDGRVDPETATSAVQANTVLAAIMLANNDVGTIQPIEAVTASMHDRGILVHTDAVQAVGKMPVNVKALEVDLLSFSAHKIHGPQGVGALYVRKGTRIQPLAFGGRQERGLRPGTENVAAIAGFGKACQIAAARLSEDAIRIESLRSGFECALSDRVPGVTINGLGAERLGNTSNISIDGVDGELLVINLDLRGLAASTGSACSAASREASHVLLAMGCTQTQARRSIRLSFGRQNAESEVCQAVELIAQTVESMRGVPQ